MKLKTTQNGSHDLIDATDENLIHDAMAAHALLRAIIEADPLVWDEFELSDWIKDRADAILREWTGVG